MPQEPSAQLSLEESIESALQRSPELAARRAELESARARLVEARTYPYNPELSAEQARREAPDASTTEGGWGLTQQLEVAGQRGKRISVAEAELAAAERTFARAEQLLVGRVALAFVDAVAARERLRIEEADAALAAELLDFEEKRLEAGKATQMEANLARAAAGRSAGRAEIARGEYTAARSALAEAAGLAPSTPPEPAGDLEESLAEAPSLVELVTAALAGRADLASLEHTRRAADSAMRLAKARAVPDIVLGGFSEREADTDRIRGLGLALSIPLFNRNQGEIAGAHAAIDRAAAELATGRLAVEREVAVARAAYEAALAAATALRKQVVGRLEENLDLLQRSFEAGKIGRAEVFLFRREFVETQREYLDAAGAAWRAQIELNLAAGRPPVGVAQRTTQP